MNLFMGECHRKFSRRPVVQVIKFHSSESKNSVAESDIGPPYLIMSKTTEFSFTWPVGVQNGRDSGELTGQYPSYQHAVHLQLNGVVASYGTLLPSIGSLTRDGY